MPEIKVEGGKELAALARHLKQTGQRDLRLEMLRGLREAAKPAKEAAQASALAELPKANGLAQEVHDAIVIRGRYSAKSATVGVAVPGHDYRMDQGFVRHPVFGHKDRPWVMQEVPVHWFSGPILRLAPRVRERMRLVLTAIAVRAAYGGRL